MRFLITTTILTTLAACGQSANEQSVVDSAEDAETALASTALEFTAENGAVYQNYLDADGTYRVRTEGEPEATGIWSVNASDDLCFKSSEPDAGMSCWSFSEEDEAGAKSVTSDTGVTAVSREIEYSPPDETETG